MYKRKKCKLTIYTKNIFITNSCTITKEKFTAKLLCTIILGEQNRKTKLVAISWHSYHYSKQVNIYKSHTQNETQSDKIIHHNSMQGFTSHYLVTSYSFKKWVNDQKNRGCQKKKKLHKAVSLIINSTLQILF